MNRFKESYDPKTFSPKLSTHKNRNDTTLIHLSLKSFVKFSQIMENSSSFCRETRFRKEEYTKAKTKGSNSGLTFHQQRISMINGGSEESFAQVRRRAFGLQRISNHHELFQTDQIKKMNLNGFIDQSSYGHKRNGFSLDFRSSSQNQNFEPIFLTSKDNNKDSKIPTNFNEYHLFDKKKSADLPVRQMDSVVSHIAVGSKEKKYSRILAGSVDFSFNMSLESKPEFRRVTGSKKFLKPIAKKKEMSVNVLEPETIEMELDSPEKTLSPRSPIEKKVDQILNEKIGGVDEIHAPATISRWTKLKNSLGVILKPDILDIEIDLPSFSDVPVPSKRSKRLSNITQTIEASKNKRIAYSNEMIDMSSLPMSICPLIKIERFPRVVLLEIDVQHQISSGTSYWMKCIERLLDNENIFEGEPGYNVKLLQNLKIEKFPIMVTPVSKDSRYESFVFLFSQIVTDLEFAHLI